MDHATKARDLCLLAPGLQVIAQDLERRILKSEESFLDFGSRTVEVERQLGRSNWIDGQTVVRKMMTAVVRRKTVEKTVDHTDSHHHYLWRALGEYRKMSLCWVRVKVRVQRAIFACPCQGVVAGAAVLLWMGVVLGYDKALQR